MSGWSSTMNTYKVPQLLDELYRSTETLELNSTSPHDKLSMLEKLENLIFNLRKMDEKELEDEEEVDEYTMKLRPRK